MSRADRPSTRPLLAKLGVAPDARVSVIGVDEPGFTQLLLSVTGDLTFDSIGPDTDTVFLAADSAGELERLTELRRSIKPDGAIWVVSRKGRAATLRDVDVIRAAIAADMVDNKVVSFSETHTALRLVVPRRLRPPRA